MESTCLSHARAGALRRHGKTAAYYTLNLAVGGYFWRFPGFAKNILA